MSALPQVSVVMTTYNRADVVNEAIESILNQTFTDFEFVIVDDGSSDRTPQVLQAYARRDKRIVIYRQDNQGLAAARNTGVAQARGKYITFMDDDDLSAPLRLERELTFLEEHPDQDACVCCGGWQKESEALSEEINFLVLYPPLFDFEWNYCVLNTMAMIKRERFVACGGYRTAKTIVEDLDFTFRFWEKQFRMAWLLEPLYHYSDQEKEQRLSTRSSLQFAHKIVATYTSACRRLAQQTDPVEEDRSMDEILQLARQLPWRPRYLIYRGIEKLQPALMTEQGCSSQEARQMLMRLTRTNRFLINLGDRAGYVVHVWVNQKRKVLTAIRNGFLRDDRNA